MSSKKLILLTLLVALVGFTALPTIIFAQGGSSETNNDNLPDNSTVDGGAKKAEIPAKGGQQKTTTSGADNYSDNIMVLPNPFPDFSGNPETGIKNFATRLTNIFLGFVGMGALLMFIYGGALYLFSAGNKDRITKGKNVLQYAIIGLAIILGAYIIVNTFLSVIGNITGKSSNLNSTTATTKTTETTNSFPTPDTPPAQDFPTP